MVSAGYDPGLNDPGRFTDATEQAVRSFQASRGLTVDGVVDAATWQGLVEAGFVLGDRLLYHRSPMLRGDDVADLQRRLGTLGFDAGRVDGIFGPKTASALLEFQQNCGLTPDGMCGHDTVVTLQRLSGRSPSTESIASVRERENVLHSDRSLASMRLVVGQTGGLAPVTRAVSRALRRHGAAVLTLDDEEWSRQAETANRYDAAVYIGFAVTDQVAALSYYATEGFESAGGKRLAELLHAHECRRIDLAQPSGMRLPILRETRMPAVLYLLRDIAEAVGRATELGDSVYQSLNQWSKAER